MLSTIFYIPLYIFFYIYNTLFKSKLEDTKKSDDIETDDTIDTNSTDGSSDSESSDSHSTCDSIPDDNKIIQEIEKEIKLDSIDDIILDPIYPAVFPNDVA